MLTRYIYLVRHGRYYIDKMDEGFGSLDSVGRRQAKSVGQWMRNKTFDDLYCSTLPRAIQTAAIACEAAGISRDVKGLRDVRECIPTVPRKFMTDPDWQRYRKPSRLKEKQTRLANVFKRLTKRPRGQDRHVMVFAHGNVIRYLCCLALEANPDAWINMQIHHAGMSVISVTSEGRIKLDHFNSIGHLPTSLITN